MALGLLPATARSQSPCASDSGAPVDWIWPAKNQDSLRTAIAALDRRIAAAGVGDLPSLLIARGYAKLRFQPPRWRRGSPTRVGDEYDHDYCQEHEGQQTGSICERAI